MLNRDYNIQTKNNRKYRKNTNINFRTVKRLRCDRNINRLFAQQTENFKVSLSSDMIESYKYKVYTIKYRFIDKKKDNFSYREDKKGTIYNKI